MAKEIERRFLVDDRRLPTLKHPQPILQGYFTKPEDSPSVRVRLISQKAFLTIKFRESALVREEFEIHISANFANKLLSQTDKKVAKKRYQIEIESLVWTIDVFEGDNSPLILAELELEKPEQTFFKPLWLGKEITQESAYNSASLSYKPYSSWK